MLQLIGFQEAIQQSRKAAAPAAHDTPPTAMNAAVGVVLT